MSAYQFEEFERRMRRINRRHSKLSHGFVTSVTDDGLVVQRPQRRARRGTLRGVALIVIALMLFKGFLYADLGAATYEARIEKLANGSMIEKGGAYAMVADPVTIWIGGLFSSLVR